MIGGNHAFKAQWQIELIHIIWFEYHEAMILAHDCPSEPILLMHNRFAIEAETLVLSRISASYCGVLVCISTMTFETVPIMILVV